MSKPELTSMDASRTARFAQFLRAAVAIKSKTINEVNKYPSVIWFSTLPAGLEQVRSPVLATTWPNDDLRWLIVSRVPEPDRPAPPVECTPWLTGVDLDSPVAPPTLNAHFTETNELGDVVDVPPTDDAQDRWKRYIDQHWTAWATKASIARTVRPLYQKLFAVHQELKGRDDAYDLFVGVGLLDSRSDASQRLRRHLLAFSAELLLDEKTGALTVVPSADFISPRVELDFLPTADRARLQPHVDGLQEALAQVGPSWHDRVAISDCLNRLVHALSSTAHYIDELPAQEAPSGHVRASFAPALILRPRSTRSLDDLLARIQADASGDSPRVPIEATPTPWRRMMEDSRVWVANGDGNGNTPAQHASIAERIYFPLPSNEEQSRIVRFANGSPGVVVQGPPGTGKSHTIANLISHYLATGRRVLVTAQTAQALEVLRDKMPADLQQLCVSLLGDTRASDKELQRSVSAILARRQDFDRGSSEERIENLQRELTEAEARLSGLERTLQESRAAETQSLEPVPGYRGTRAQIARRLRDEKTSVAWIEDPIPHQTPCPVYSSGWDQLADYHAGLNENLRSKLAKQCIPLPFTREEAVAAVERIIRALSAVPSGTPAGSIANPPSSVSAESFRHLERWLEDLQKAELSEGPENYPWLRELRATLLHSNLVAWRALQDEASETTAKLSDAVVAKTVRVEVAARSATEARRDVARLADHYAAGGKRRVLLFLKPRVVKETDWVEGAVQLESANLRNPDDVNRAREALDGWACFDAAWEVWNRWPSVRTGSPRQQVATLRHRRHLLDALLRISDGLPAIASDLRLWLSEALAAEIRTTDLLLVVRRALAELALAQARTDRDGLVRQLRHVIGNRDVVPSVVRILDGLVSESVEQLYSAFDDLAEELAAREGHKLYRDFISSVQGAAPRLADAIVAEEGTQVWRTRFPTFQGAWLHRRAQSWLDLLLSAERVEATHRAARDERGRIQDVISQITAERAWLGALQRIDDLRRASLVAWAKAVSNIPATGLSVFRKRAVAQTLLGRCLDAIPAWVVSLGRLYETVGAHPGLFDVAIVDEASQCWLDSLVLLYLAKQIIVVGDDKQISPTVVGVGDVEIAHLASAFLQDFSFRGSFTIESSLFDHAQRYLSAGVPLREHFRCVPEIIRFSNELCYTGNPLVPLRQVGRNRLEPLKTTYLSNGLRHGDVNDAEARAVVDAIVKCHEDPSYDESDFGVICLQGDMQAARIQHLLVERLGPAVFSQRKLRCGNPYAFQGDERDVMFLSMVAAPNANNATLTTSMYQQRFNVALSRARDQAWLFHSIQEHELGPNCLRRRVLEFFKQPPDLTIHGSSVDTPTLQLAALRADRLTERPPKPFDSWFEVDVALALAARGYTLSAQVEVARKRIDLVVEGDEGVRLAVECDGEAWHGPEQYELDMFRQRQLERAGWRFVRVRESLFYAHEQKAIDEVIGACNELEIGIGGERAKDAEVSMRINEVSSLSMVADTTEPDVTLADERERQESEGASYERPSLFSTDERRGPFTGYGGKHYPDPRTAPAGNVREAVLDVISTDGPLPKESIYKLYRDGCPRIERAGKQVRQAINRAIHSLERAGLVTSSDEGKRRDPTEVVVRLASHPNVVPRPAGARSLDDVPLSELATVMHSLSTNLRSLSEDESVDLCRAVAREFGVRRLMPAALQRLRLAARLDLSPAQRNGAQLF